MKILEETEVRLERADLLSRSPISRPITKKGRLYQAARTPGIHLSGILHYIAIESGMRKVIEQMDEDELPLRMAMGLAWEEFAASLYPAMLWQPGEVSYEDVLMTCDGHSFDANDVFSLEEFKLTWKKRKDGAAFCREEWYWLQQARGYCWGYGADTVRFHVCYVMGDYRGAGPVYMRYVIQFTENEINTSAKMLVANRERAKLKGYAE